MINLLAYDLEILPNFLSLTFVNLKQYLDVFKDCKINGKVVALTKKYTVAEIKEKLDSIETQSFYITDTNDSDLLKIVAYFSQMRAHFVAQTNPETGEVENVPVRTDLYSFNGNGYDNLMVAASLMYYNRFANTRLLLKHLHEISARIIRLQNDKDSFFNDSLMQLLRNYPLPFYSVDIMKLFALDKVFKSLKQTSINLRWHELLEFELPPICDKDRHLYNLNIYENISNERLTKLVDRWDRYIIEEYIPPMMYYNKNDVFIVCECVRQKMDEVRLRYSISNSYNIDVLSASRSKIADKLFIKFYSEFSGVHPKNFLDLRTERTALSFKKVIFDIVKFKTKYMQDILEYMKTVTIYKVSKEEFTKIVEINGTTYTIATGGLHSNDLPRMLYSTDEYTYVHYDIGSFYPSLMIAFNIFPAHLNGKDFIKLLRWLRDTRLTAKHAKEEVIPGINNKVLAEVLKIVINATYGKLGFDSFFIYDRLALLKVTINGQLLIMMLIEELELNGIHVVSGNTDGIVVKLYNNKRDDFKRITESWMEKTGFTADSEEYECYINRDVNNYVIREKPNKKGVRNITSLGCLNPDMCIKDLQKGYNNPIVAEAVVKFFLDNVPVMDTITNCTDILDFCKTQNVGKQYKLEYTTSNSERIIRTEVQRNCRYYVTNNTGGILEKVKNDAKTGLEKRERLCAGQRVAILNSLDDKDIALRDINYKYYYEQAMAIINPIKLSISNSKRSKIKKYAGMYNPLFDFEDED